MSQSDNGAGEEANKPGVLKFFRDMSKQEKEDADRYAAAVLELTAVSIGTESVGGWDDSSEITSAFPSLINVPRSTVATLGHLLRDCDSISNPSELPSAIAELVSVCRERNDRLEEAESVIQRLEDLTGQLLLMQQQHYEVLSNPTESKPPPQIERRAEEDTLGTRSSRTGRSDPPAEIFSSRTREIARRSAKDPPATAEAKPGTGEQQTGHDVTVPDKESVNGTEDQSSEAPSNEQDISNDKMPIQKKDSGADPPERENQVSRSLKNTSTVVSMLKPAPKAAPKTSDVAPLQQSSKPVTSSKRPDLDDSMVQSIVAEVMKKLNAGNSEGNSNMSLPGSDGTLPTAGNSVIQVLVRDAKDKMTTDNPNDWIVERLRPPGMEGAQQEKIEPPGANEAGYLPKENEGQGMKRPAAIDPPELDGKMPAVEISPDMNASGDTSKSISHNSESSVGAYRFSASHCAPTAAAAASQGSPPTPMAGTVPPVATSSARQAAEDRKAKDLALRPLGLTPQELSTTGDGTLLGSLSTAEDFLADYHGARFYRPGGGDNRGGPLTTTEGTAPATGIEAHMEPGIPVEAHTVPGIEAHAVPNADERESNILELTQAVLSLQQELVRREQEIPRAEVVKTGCQCVIL